MNGSRGWKVVIVGTVLCAVAVFAVRHRPLTLERVREELGPDPDLVFEFATGPDNPQLTCEQMGSQRDERTATAVAAGWLVRRCEDDHVQLRLTAEGRRRSVHWLRSGDGPGFTRQPEDDREWTDWFVTAAHFERTALPRTESTDARDRKRVVVPGRWMANDEGQILRRAGWAELQGPAERDEDFVLAWGRWRRIPKLLGRDLDL
jgi:hypothetical protein